MTARKKKRKQLLNVDEIVRQYEQIRPSYVGFTEKLHTLLQDILGGANIKYHVIEKRTKDTFSFREKITRSSKQYSDPLQQVTDLVGLRIIVYYLGDVELVSELIEKEFKFDPDASGDRAKLLHPNEFGYRSVHYIVSLSANRGALLEWQSFRNIKAEIQVRTVLQHAWAAISHTLQYKKEEDVPSLFRRRLSRLAGLLELSDEEFSGLRKEQLSLSKEISTQINEGNTDLEINTDTVTEYIAKSQYIDAVAKTAEDIGYAVGNLPPEYTSDLISLLSFLGISTIRDLDASIKLSKAEYTKYFQELYNDRMRDDRGVWLVDKVFISTLLLIKTNFDKLSKETLVRIGWYEEFSEWIINKSKRID